MTSAQPATAPNLALKQATSSLAGTSLKPEDMYHTAIVVSDLEQAMQTLSLALGREWMPIREGQAEGFRGEHLSTQKIRLAFSVGEPVIELFEQQEPGSIWDIPDGGLHHIGFWTDNLVEDAERLEALGFVSEFVMTQDGTNRPQRWTYHRDPISGLRVELVDRALKPVVSRRWSLDGEDN